MGNADSKWNVVNIGDNTRKSFRYKPSSRLYVSAIAKKMILDFVLVLGYVLSFKKTTNPNVSPIGKRFGFECFGAGDRT